MNLMKIILILKMIKVFMNIIMNMKMNMIIIIYNGYSKLNNNKSFSKLFTKNI